MASVVFLNCSSESKDKSSECWLLRAFVVLGYIIVDNVELRDDKTSTQEQLVSLFFKMLELEMYRGALILQPCFS